ncbi:MAG: phosphopantothenoylcysteine decarboxylase, partial [Phycisphaerae bacterium]|nr:phosphopantothenoylcysteine decarboxylase [Phycisphaerae bacterium]
AGGTREYIDPVRFISNASSGKMGYALAAAALKAGHKVSLITTIKTELKTQNSKLKTFEVETAAQMFAAVKKHFKNCDCLIMAAAVSDYTPAKVSKTKIKKADKELTIKLKPTTDILKWAGKNKKANQIVVGFALEDKNLRANAEKKLKSKNLDMIIANSPCVIGAERSAVQIKHKTGDWLVLPKTTKSAIAKKIISLLCQGLLS